MARGLYEERCNRRSEPCDFQFVLTCRLAKVQENEQLCGILRISETHLLGTNRQMHERGDGGEQIRFGLGEQSEILTCGLLRMTMGWSYLQDLASYAFSFQLSSMNRVIPTTSFRVCLQLWMLVSSMWVGPVPVGHSHTNAMNSRGGGEALAQHLMRHHSDGSCDNVGCKWHVHWVIRESGYSGLHGEASAVPAMAVGGATSSELRDITLGDQPVTLLVFTPSLPTECILAGANWLSGHSLCRPSLSTFSSVMRC
ncbi:hypothetical protein Q31a_40900 [Aureliella helgolandensis]|uniref:Uncharacterized protein n=1 Tax=Aureliella helgolandensis TaxID=2527968 RepID=A0A518GB20_9BACT|nr:hypothetical protein Q31a_40900 [Aureliella helgolandensis]